MLDNRILITGGTGSLGRALLKRLASLGITSGVTILSRDETKQGSLRSKYPDHKYILGDVAKFRDVKRAFRDIDLVFHFAAYKQVPSAQNNVPATIETNILGSLNVVDAALECGVKQVVASSTDKACAPVNAYGASKYLMECIFQDANKHDATTFHLARYGNVVGSNASVIPLFFRLQEQGKPVTVTVPEMTRFWITLDTAVDLVFRALNCAPGAIVVPKAKAMSMRRLATMFSSNVKVIGIRPGEKVHEAMVSEAESFHTVTGDDYFYIYPPYSGALHDEPFSYTSDTCEQLTEMEMQEMIDEYLSNR